MKKTEKEFYLNLIMIKVNKMTEIKDVKKISSGVYLINECVQISNIGLTTNGEFYSDIEFNEHLITEEQAEELVKKFVSDAVSDQLTQKEIYVSK